jgi:hypothetical protein
MYICMLDELRGSFAFSATVNIFNSYALYRKSTVTNKNTVYTYRHSPNTLLLTITNECAMRINKRILNFVYQNERPMVSSVSIKTLVSVTIRSLIFFLRIFYLYFYMFVF